MQAWIVLLPSPKPSPSVSAYHVCGVEMVKVVIELAGLAHGAVGFAVHVNVTLPAVLSAVLGV